MINGLQLVFYLLSKYVVFQTIVEKVMCLLSNNTPHLEMLYIMLVHLEMYHHVGTYLYELLSHHFHYFTVT